MKRFSGQKKSKKGVKKGAFPGKKNRVGKRCAQLSKKGKPAKKKSAKLAKKLPPTDFINAAVQEAQQNLSETAAETKSEKQELERDHQFAICRWIALRKTDNEIVDLLFDVYGIGITRDGVAYYRRDNRWRKVVEYLRQRYIRNVQRIPICAQEHRLWALNEALQHALSKTLKSRSEYGDIYERKIGNVPALIEQARLELRAEEDSLKREELVFNLVTLVRRYGSEGKTDAGNADRAAGGIIPRRDALNEFLAGGSGTV